MNDIIYRDDKYKIVMTGAYYRILQNHRIIGWSIMKYEPKNALGFYRAIKRIGLAK